MKNYSWIPRFPYTINEPSTPYEWVWYDDGRASWAIYYGDSRFLVASGPSWSVKTGMKMYTTLVKDYKYDSAVIFPVNDIPLSYYYAKQVLEREYTLLQFRTSPTVEIELIDRLISEKLATATEWEKEAHEVKGEFRIYRMVTKKREEI